MYLCISQTTIQVEIQYIINVQTYTILKCSSSGYEIDKRERKMTDEKLSQ